MKEQLILPFIRDGPAASIQLGVYSINLRYQLKLKYRKGDDYMIEEKALLNVDETRAYLGLGDTMTRQLMRKEYFGLRIGCRLYSSKILLDKWIGEQAKKKRQEKMWDSCRSSCPTKSMKRGSIYLWEKI